MLTKRTMKLSAVTTSALAVVAGIQAGGALPAQAASRPEWCRTSADLDARELPSRIKKSDCDLTGRVVRAGALAVHVPPGQGAVLSVTRVNGGERLAVLPNADGSEYAVEHRSSAGAAEMLPGDSGGSGTAECTTSTYVRATQGGYEYRQAPIQLPWYFNPSSQPTYLMSPLNTIQAGASDMVLGRNNCGITSVPRSSHAYMGTTSRDVNISGTGLSCYAGDGYSIVKWGAMNTDALAVTCAHVRNGGEMFDGDIRLNTKYTWDDVVSDGCRPSSYDIESVVAHEWGHVAGLDDLYNSGDAALTMYGYGGTCDPSKRSLGRGDVLGMLAIYGAR